MIPASFIIRGFRRFAQRGLFSILVLGASSLSATELLIERRQPPPDRFPLLFGPLAATFSLEEPTRIQAVQGWMAGEGLVTSSLLVNLHSKLFSESFSLKPIEVKPGETPPPAMWQGMSSLQWDLPAGTYELSFDAGAFPIAYGYATPPTHPEPSDYWYLDLNENVWHESFPFGVRIYGAPLSAVPEPATYGLLGSVILLALATVRRSFSRGTASRICAP